MKKTITLMLLLAIAGSANADLVLKKMESSISVCPGIFSADGNSVAYSCNYSTGDIIIYDQDFLVDKTFSVVTSEYQSGNVTEEATVIPTGVTVVPEDQYGNKNYSMSAQWEASSQEEMINRLKEESYSSSYIAFTDPFGNPACYKENTFTWDFAFAYENIYGKKYPRNWYALIDGMVYYFSIPYYNDNFYKLAYDEESAVWIRTSENLSTSYSTAFSLLVRIDGVDVGDITISQTLFNDDEKWEYLLPEYGPLEFSGSPSINAQPNNDGTVTLTRSGNMGSSRMGCGVYNEDGEKLGNILGSFSSPEWNGHVINGRKFLRTYNEEEGLSYLYEIKGSDGDFDLVETVQASSSRKLGAARGIVTVDINAEQAGGEVVVSTPDGKVMANKKVGIGQTQVNDQPLPSGIYVVSLLKDGRVVESEKYLVQ